MALDFIVTNKETQLSTATFIPDYAVEKADRKKGKIPSFGYNGPELSSLDENLQEGIYAMLDGVGLNAEVLQRASQFGVAY